MSAAEPEAGAAVTAATASPFQDADTSPRLRIADLGPLKIVHSRGERPCTAPKQAALLAVLTLDANRRVTLDRLSTAGWGYDSPVSPATIENHIWRLRRLIDPDHAKPSTSPLVNDNGGYRLQLGPHATDSAALLAAARRMEPLLTSPDDAARAVRIADEALCLWRGDPYAVIAHLTTTAATTAQLNEIREQLTERRIAALILSGRTDQALADLHVVLETYPFREQLWHHQMSALSQTGRTEEALQAYQRARTVFRDELGLEPSIELQDLHQRLLRGTAPPTPASPASPASPPMPSDRPFGAVGPADDVVSRQRRPQQSSATPGARRRLPRSRGALVGRSHEIAALTGLLDQHALVTVVGIGGCGKTRIALEVARTQTRTFPDGVWFIDLTAVTSPHQVAGAIASGLGLTTPTSDPLDLLGDFFASRAALLLLDNCEHVLDGVAAVLDEVLTVGGPSVFLATSRQPLGIDPEHLLHLRPLPVGVDGAPHAGADEGPQTAPLSAAATLFEQRLRRELEPAERQLAEEICAAVDGLPLAIELAAARAEVFTLGEIHDQIHLDPSRIDRIGRGEQTHHSSLWTSIEWSHRLLGSVDQAVHRRLAVLPGPFTLPAGTAVAQSSDLDVLNIPSALARLTHRSLLERVPPSAPGRPTLFRQLDTVRAHARHLLDQTSETSSAQARRDTWVRQLIESRPPMGHADNAALYDNLDDSAAALRATLLAAVVPEPDPALLRAAAALGYYWYFRGRLIEGRTLVQAIVDAGLWSRLETPPPETVLFRLNLAAGHFLSGDVDVAAAQVAIAFRAIDTVREDLVEDLAEVLATLAATAWARNEYAHAQHASAALHRLVDRYPGSPHREVLAEQSDLVAHLVDRDPSASADKAEALFHDPRAQENKTTLWTSSAVRMIVSVPRLEPEAGLHWARTLIPLHASFGNGGGGAFLEALANFASMTGDHDRAIRMYAASYVETRNGGMIWPVQLDTAELLERSNGAVGSRRDELWRAGTELTYARVAADLRQE